MGEVPYFEVDSNDYIDGFEGPIIDQESFYERLYDFIDYNLNTNYKVTTLCYLVDPTGHVMEATLEEDGYYKSIHKCIGYYTRTEEYEKCTLIKKLINEYGLF